jgi:hypothetical protein
MVLVRGKIISYVTQFTLGPMAQITLIIVKISFNDQTFLQLCEIIEIFLLIQIEFLKFEHTTLIIKHGIVNLPNIL